MSATSLTRAVRLAVLAALPAVLSSACAHDPSNPGTPGAPGGGGMGGLGSGGGNQGGGGGALPAPEEDAYEPAPPPPALPEDVRAALAAQIDLILAGGSVAGATHGIEIVHSETGVLVYDKNPDLRLKPASNTKLLTTATAIARLGADHQLVTRAYALPPDASGVISGDLTLIGAHDFTWSTRFYDDPRFPLDQLATQLADAGVTQIAGTTIASGELAYQASQFGTYDAAAHRAAAASQFVAALADAGIATNGTGTSTSFDPPAGTSELASWSSPSLPIGASPINRSSMNEMADALSRHVGQQAGGESSYAAGAVEFVSLLDDLGLDTAGVEFFDGSGLSHSNRIAPHHLVGLLRGMADHPAGAQWRRTLALSGVHGTITSRMTGADTIGRVRAKTGTLNGVIALSGTLDHRYDGQRYAFSLLANDVSSQSAMRGAHDDIVRALAADLRELGTRPTPPTLQCVRNAGNGGGISVEWSDGGDADAFIVWRSRDGLTWNRSDARMVDRDHHTTLTFDDSPLLFVRITALGEAGESAPSDVYGARAAATTSRVLLVDGNDRFSAEPAFGNPTGRAHDFLAVHARAMPAAPFDSCADEVLSTLAVELDAYDAVVWSTGEDAETDESLSAVDQILIRAYAESGGSLFISGSELGWDLFEQGLPEDQAFFSDVLRAGYEGDDAGTFTVRGAQGALAGVGPFGFFTPDRMVVDFPDRLGSGGEVTPILEYLGGAGGVAAVQWKGAYRLVYLGFPFESIDHPGVRRDVMIRAMTFLGVE